MFVRDDYTGDSLADHLHIESGEHAFLSVHLNQYGIFLHMFARLESGGKCGKPGNVMGGEAGRPENCGIRESVKKREKLDTGTGSKKRETAPFAHYICRKHDAAGPWASFSRFSVIFAALYRMIGAGNQKVIERSRKADFKAADIETISMTLSRDGSTFPHKDSVK